MRVLLMDGETIGRWVEMRLALWPDTPEAEHRAEVESCLAENERYASFLCEDEAGVAAGFAEASIRRDYVNGCETSPVGFLEGIYVLPGFRRRGVARALITAVERWPHRKDARNLPPTRRPTISGARACTWRLASRRRSASSISARSWRWLRPTTERCLKSPDQHELVDIDQSAIGNLQVRDDRKRQEGELQEGFFQRRAEREGGVAEVM